MGEIRNSALPDYVRSKCGSQAASESTETSRKSQARDRNAHSWGQRDNVITAQHMVQLKLSFLNTDIDMNHDLHKFMM